MSILEANHALPSPDLWIHKASLSFKNNLIFNNLSFRLKGGKITCLLGSSGIGKTSLFRLIMGLPLGSSPTLSLNHFNTSEPPLPDNVHSYCERYTSDGNPLKHRLSYLAQEDLLLPWLTVQDNIFLGYTLRRKAPPPILKQQLPILCEKMSLSPTILNAYPKSLSGGMRQRVALARTLVENQPFLFVDEPFSGLDAVLRQDMQTLFWRLTRGKTIAMITHDPWEALSLADTIYVFSGVPAQLYGPYTPPGDTLRPPYSPQCYSLYETLLDQLKQRGNS